MIRLIPDGLLSPPPLRVDGPNVFIRPAQPRDWKQWAEIREASREFLVPWEPTWPPDALTQTAFNRRLRRQAAEWRDDETYSFLTFEQRSELVVGGIGLTNVRRGVAQMGSMGYWVGRPYARRGYTSEAARLMLSFAFGQLGLHRVEAACLPTNQASSGVLEKVGFTKEGYARAYLRINDKWADHILYAILRDDWAAGLHERG
ncbi:GNAT family N-acetyltransferase [Niveispirillum cyanobacteriorum]|uniref:30S ribosomal protein S5 alanine N-acetyltransferase n=1 Tax=Niveispirillum cyanobacteriorum TaxID=1612173 RepID=A0A2K9NGW8_9PROT|nr:GNAT family protein [Niveispirillum cyanobacteriorum]AUN31505.1 30S ribosomal protein S5 alanine N-acetyltransferase [Niveispirillum cyanobacteriorum]